MPSTGPATRRGEVRTGSSCPRGRSPNRRSGRSPPWSHVAQADRARAGRRRRPRRLVGLLGQGTLDEDDLTWLRTLFGAAVLERHDVPGGPDHGIPALVAGFDRLLDVKLERLERLRCRARAGSVLRQDVEGLELAWSWGVQDVVDPDRPALRGPAASVCAVDPRAALPLVEVLESTTARAGPPGADLLSAAPSDPVFVGEVDDDGYLWLRFGDGRQGKVPPAGARLVASYKVGNGTRGNVGAESIDTFEPCGLEAGAIRVRNPLPACGGRDPESSAEARQRAPREAFTVLARAVTADDYARAADGCARRAAGGGGAAVDGRLVRGPGRHRRTGQWRAGGGAARRWSVTGCIACAGSGTTSSSARHARSA